MKKRDKIESALSHLDDSMIKEFAEHEKTAARRNLPLRKIIAAAAIVALVAVTVTVGVFLGRDNGGVTDAVPEQGSDFRIVDVKANLTNGYFISGDTSFDITVANGDLEDLRSSIAITPAVDYTISERGDDTYRLTPASAFADNTLVKIASVENKVVLSSWAFQTSEILSVSGTYPADGEMYCSIETVYELHFSYADVEDVPSHVTFEPSIDGTWEHVGKIWRFIPSASLAQETVYTVTVSPGLKCGDMEISYGSTFTFGTKSGANLGAVTMTPQYVTVDNIATYLPGQDIAVAFTTNASEDDLSEMIDRVTVSRFESQDDFIRHLDGYYVPAETVGDAEFEIENISSSSLHYVNHVQYNYKHNMILDGITNEGYYLATVYGTDGRVLLRWNMQISHVSVYALQTGNELLLWTASGGSLISVPVKLLGESYNTDENGVLRLDVTGKDLDGEYIFVGGDVPQLIGADSVSVTYKSAYLYTDLSAYRPDDTINVWGVVPVNYLPEEAEKSCELVIGNDLFRIPVELDEAGTFCASYTMSGFDTGSLALALELDGRVLARKSVRIAKYEDQNYSYELSVPKNCILPGETLEASVRVTHLSGINAVGKQVKLTVRDTEYLAVTDETGVAHFTVPAEDTEKIGNEGFAVPVGTISVIVYDPAGRNSYQRVARYDGCYIITRDEQIVSYTDDGVQTFAVGKIVVPESRVVDDRDELDGGSVDREITVQIYETVNTRYVKGYTYNAYTKENEPNYDYKEEQRLVDTYTVTTVNGEHKVELNSYRTAEDTADVTYSYSARASYVLDGVEISSDRFVYFDRTEPAPTYTTQTTVRKYRSPLYEYYFGLDVSDIAEGDTLTPVLEDYDGAVCDSGKVMRILFTDRVKDAAVFDASEDMSFTYGEELLGGAVLTGAYFIDGKFYPVYETTLKANNSNMELGIKIDTDKSSYAPGETVSLSVKAAYPDGSPAAGAKVNLSVMNTAVGNLPNIGSAGSYSISSLLRCPSYDRYVFSSHGNYATALNNDMNGATGKGGDDVRDEFYSSPYFGTVTTDENGEATVTFKLSDDVTEYTVTAHGVNEKLYCGAARDTFKVKQDFMIDTFETYGVKPTDDLVILAVCNGGDGTVDVTFSLLETGETVSLSGRAGEILKADFGKKPAGEYTVEIRAESGDVSDAVRYKVSVTDGEQSFVHSEEHKLDGEISFTPSGSQADVSVHTAQYERYVRYLNYLSRSSSLRRDNSIAFAEATSVGHELGFGYYSSFDNSTVYVVNNQLLNSHRNAASDAVFTAMAMHISHAVYGTNYEKVSAYLTSASPKTLTEAVELTVLAAALGEPVLADLDYLAETTDDDDYIRVLMAVGYVISGDYAKAKTIYEGLGDDSGDEGYKALKAYVAVYVDRDGAGKLLDSLIKESSSEFMLGFAVVAYMNERVDVSDEEYTVRVKCGSYDEEHTFTDLKPVRLSLLTENGEKLTVTGDSRAIVRVSGRVAVDSGKAEKDAFDVTLSGEKTDENGIKTVDLTIDLTEYADTYGEIGIVLPDGLMMASNPELSAGYRIKSLGGNLISIVKYGQTDITEDYSPVLTISLVKRHDGEFVMEKVVFTADNSSYVSRTPITE